VNPGDYVRLETGDEGYIIDVGWRNTTIRSVSNNLILIPNSKLASNIVTNYTLPETALTLIIPTSVSYHDDLEKVENTALDAARAVIAAYEGTVKDFEPLCVSHVLAYVVRIQNHSKREGIIEQFRLRSCLHQELKFRFDDSWHRNSFTLCAAKSTQKIDTTKHVTRLAT
jgi:small-conductance mechanosensitive channel